VTDTEREMLAAQAESNNQYLDRDPKALSRQQWVEASIMRFELTIASWPETERVEAWRSMMLACDAALRQPEAPPVIAPVADEPFQFSDNF
jgi:hypothetical protein